MNVSSPDRLRTRLALLLRANAILLWAALVGCAESGNPESSGSQAAERTAPRCFRASDARNFRSVDATTVNLNDTQNLVATLDDLTVTLTQDDPNA